MGIIVMENTCILFTKINMEGPNMSEKNKCYLIVEIETDQQNKSPLEFENVRVDIPGVSQAKIVDVSPFYPIIPYERRAL